MRGGGGDAAGHISTAHGISTSEGVRISGVILWRRSHG